MPIQSASPRRSLPPPDLLPDRGPRPSTARAAIAAVVVLVLLSATLPASAHDVPQQSGEDQSAAPTSTTLAGAEAASNGDGDGSAGQPDVPAITFPVVGPVTFSDTWGACRGSGCSRAHQGVDIFGYKLAPLVAAEDGVITFIRQSAMSIAGNTVIIESDSGWRYLYIHINNDSPGTDDGSNPQGWIVPNRLRVGDRVTAGQVIGYLGDSGNAETTPAHVHFEVHEPGVGAVNPTPFVQAASDAGRLVSVASLASTPEGRAEAAPTVDAWYRALLGREPTPMELFAWTDRFDIGFATVDDLIADLTMAKSRRDPAGAIVRSFRVSLDRLPTINEIRQWEEVYRNGTGLDEITASLIDSEAFDMAHGPLSDEEFVGLIYRNAIGRGPSDTRLADWLDLFAEGTPRSALTAYWADSYSVKDSSWHGLEVIQAYRAAADRMPTAEEYDRWVDHLDAGGLIPDIVDDIRNPTPADGQADAPEGSATADDTTTGDPAPGTGDTSGEPATDATTATDATAGDGGAGDATAGDGGTGDGGTGDATAGDGGAGDGGAGDATAGDGGAGDATAGDGGAGDSSDVGGNPADGAPGNDATGSAEAATAGG